MKINWKLTVRIWILIIALALSLLAIRPTFESGVVVKSVVVNSSIFNEGLKAGEIIKDINGIKITNKETYANAITSLVANATEVKLNIKTKSNDYIIFTNQSPDITIDDISPTRIQTGLDLRGGARALVQPDQNITSNEMDDLIQVARNRFNVYGLADVNIRAVSDLQGRKFMLVEVAGATPTDLEDLIAQQGKFEAKVGNITVFEGGNKDIADVCRNRAECSGITSCDPVQDGTYACSFRFAVYLRQEAAQKHADVTANISLDSSGQYLSEKLYLYVDGKEVDSLLIGASLRGQAATEISIEGSGRGKTQQDALLDARTSMNRLQTILITGSLPYKLSIVKLDTISPLLGKDFLNLIMIAAASAIGLVSLIVFAKYRRIKASLALLLTSFSEIIIILGFAAFIKWNLDLPSIAGILATIGTGVDQQIIILDEAEKGESISLKEKMKRALFVIVSAYFTVLVSLLPLYWAGAGLFKGFALTTIIGITAGILITRPAFSDIIKMIESH